MIPSIISNQWPKKRAYQTLINLYLRDCTIHNRKLQMQWIPCERAAEVSDAMLDGKWGEACYDEAENRLHAQKGVMACIIP